MYQALRQALGIATAMNRTNKKLMFGAENPEKNESTWLDLSYVG